MRFMNVFCVWAGPLGLFLLCKHNIIWDIGYYIAYTRNLFHITLLPLFQLFLKLFDLALHMLHCLSFIIARWSRWRWSRFRVLVARSWRWLMNRRWSRNRRWSWNRCCRSSLFNQQLWRYFDYSGFLILTKIKDRICRWLACDVHCVFQCFVRLDQADFLHATLFMFLLLCFCIKFGCRFRSRTRALCWFFLRHEAESKQGASRSWRWNLW